jgi:penicillin-insensitive murein DD-endopeptidase
MSKQGSLWAGVLLPVLMVSFLFPYGNIRAEGKKPTVSKKPIKTPTKPGNKKPEEKKYRGKHRSHGFPNRGKLVGGKRWKDTRYAKRVKRTTPPAYYGMPSMVDLIHRATRFVGRKHKGEPLLIGDFSLENGGTVPGHNSHQNGRDADIGFYAFNDKKRSAMPDHFIAYDHDGKSIGEKQKFEFDTKRNWSLVVQLLEDQRVHIRAIFVAYWLKNKMLAYGKKIRSKKSIIEKATIVLQQPTGTSVHNDHFHVRIACHPSQKAFCFDDSIGPPLSCKVWFQRTRWSWRGSFRPRSTVGPKASINHGTRPKRWRVDSEIRISPT